MATKKPLLDIGNRNEEFARLSERMARLDEAFRMILSDFSHHIEVIFFKQEKSDLLNIKADVEYRLFAAQFHLRLLLQHHHDIEEEVQRIYSKDAKQILQEVYPSHPLFDRHQNEANAIFDSIVFHLASIFDYFSAMINFICKKKDRSITKWSNLARACRHPDNAYYALPVGEEIRNQDREFVQKLYEYRSRLIHEKSYVNPIRLTIDVMSGKTQVRFEAASSLCKKFPSLEKKSVDNEITAAFAAKFLMEETITSIVKLLFRLKAHMESHSTYPNHIAGHEIIMLYSEPGTGRAYPMSKPYWEELSKYFQLNL